jgi:lipoprotein-anchoring transpeptidase ErfK/SrfK
MRSYENPFLLVAALVLFFTPLAKAEPLDLVRLFSGEKTETPAKKAGSEKKTEKLSFFGGPKRVEIDLTSQTLRAYEGNRVVLKTNISSGRNGATPTGSFKAGWKHADHYSSLYHNAPMPWSVQVRGNIFIHGFTVVPDYPASHGCIRMPLTGSNPAKKFFHWVEPGTPIKIAY